MTEHIYKTLEEKMAESWQEWLDQMDSLIPDFSTHADWNKLAVTKTIHDRGFANGCKCAAEAWQRSIDKEKAK